MVPHFRLFGLESIGTAHRIPLRAVIPSLEYGLMVQMGCIKMAAALSQPCNGDGDSRFFPRLAQSARDDGFRQARPSVVER